MNKYILIVEDDEDIAINLQELLENEGYAVNLARNGSEALNRLQAAADLPALILLDLMTPKMNGFEFRRIQQDDPRLQTIPVVVMTAAHLDEKDAPPGIDGFLQKPFDMDSVLSLARRYMS